MIGHDYCHCDNDRCPLTEKCLRSTTHLATFRGAKWYSHFSPDPETGVCRYFWPIDTQENKEHDKK